MGSFANSLHVKSNDADRVAATVTEFFAQAGWQPTTRSPGNDDQGGLSNLRALQVSAPREGWVSILDSDLAGANSLAQALAGSLQTHAIFFFVNDSDAWSYMLADPKGRVSEFDSDDGADDDDDVDEESLANLEQLAQRAARLRELMSDPAHLRKLQDLSTQMLAEAPPEIREIHDRLQKGKFAPAEVQRYQTWSSQQMPKYQARLQALLGVEEDQPRPMPKGKPKPKRKATQAEQRAQKKRLDQLRPLFAAGVRDEQVQAVFDKRAVFAEDLLAELLPLLGIADFYANLSYRFLSESTPDELASHRIHFVHHLHFETNSPAQSALS